MTSDQLLRHPEGKWSASEILEHLARAFANTTKGLRRCLDAGRSSASVPTLKHRIAATMVVRLGYLPTGGRAPERTRPKGIPPAEAMQSVRENLIMMDEVLARCAQQFGRHGAILDHPILGPLTLAQWQKFHWVHTRHHMKQIAKRRLQAGIGHGIQPNASHSRNSPARSRLF